MMHSSGPDRDGAIVVHISQDDMLATIDLYPHHGSGKPLDLDSVEYMMLAEGVTTGVDRESIAEGIRKTEETGEPVKGVRGAQGTLPVKTIPLHFDILVKAQASHPDSEQKVDYREFANIPIVRKNDVLAQPIPRVEGSPGHTVKGKEIPIVDAPDKTLEAGDNVSILSNGTYVARDDGRLIQEKNRIRVESALIVESDVDFSTGNIRFPKDVVVNGNILDDFVVETNANLTVKGLVGAATLSVKGSVEIMGGFSGKGRGTIHAGAGAKIAYLDNGSLLCLGSVIVGNEIVNSIVRANGKVTCIGKKGTIIGGSVSAKGGIECSTAGSERGHVTHLEAGVDVMVAARLKKAEGLIARLSERISAVNLSLEEAQKHGRSAPSLERERKDLLKKLNELTVLREELRSTIHSPEGASIIVRNRIHAGVIVAMCGVEKNITAPAGPSTLTLAENMIVSDKQGAGSTGATGARPKPGTPAAPQKPAAP